MASEQRSLDDYVDVATRIADFRAKYPEGVLRPVVPERPFETVIIQNEWCVQCIGRRQVKSGKDWRTCPRCNGTGLRGEDEPKYDVFIAYTAAAYREPGDPNAGVGVAWEPYPGRTPYTSASELMNAETSAQGRAIVAVGASDSKRGIASREEVRNRQAERESTVPDTCSCGHSKHRDMDCVLCGCKLRWNRDGSLSRSRTDDEQKDAAGVMTDGQQDEHTSLRPKKAEVAAGLASGAGIEDVWHWDSGLPPPPETSQDTPGTITRQQQSAMHAAFAALGMGGSDTTTRNRRLLQTRKLLGLERLASSSDLSYRQAGTLLEKLEQRQREGTRA